MYADAEAVIKIAKALVDRAAKLVVAALIGVLTSSKEENRSGISIRTVGITFDGSLWKSFPYLADKIRTEANMYIEDDIELQFRTSYDGSAKGAAFIAATSRQ